MSLNWGVGDVKDYKTVCYQTMTREEVEAAGHTIEALVNKHSFMGGDWYVPGSSDLERLSNCNTIERLNPLTNCFIWATMSVSLRGITEENHVEFWLRMSLLEKLNGPFLSKRDPDDNTKWVPRQITLDEVKSHIGLTCNVGDLSWREWLTRTLDTVRAETLRRAGVKDDRGLPRDMKISQVAKDTMDQMETLESALKDHYLGDDEEEERRHDKDYSRVCRMLRWLREAEAEWESIECRLEEEAELAAEEE